MFDKKHLASEDAVLTWLNNLRTDTTYTLGRFTNQPSLEGLIDNLGQARYLEVKKLPKRQQTIYVTHDLGTGYMNYFSIRFLYEQISLGLIPKDIQIHCEYAAGNVFCRLKDKDFNTQVLKTDEVYVFVDDATGQLTDIKIGKPTNPNYLYFQDEYDGVILLPEQCKKIEGIRAVWVDEYVEFNWL